MNMATDLTATLKNPFKFRLFLIKKLPMAFLAGIRLVEISEKGSAVSIRYKYLTQNPFRSLYFACLAMAGEFSTGVLAIQHIHKFRQPVSMLVVHLEADFLKKATGKVVFSCRDGEKIKRTIEEAISSGEGKMLVTTSAGVNEEGDKVAEFRITWSFKARKTVS